jgi:general secretion pathway protein K
MATLPYEISVFEALLDKLGIEKGRADEITQSVADNIDGDSSPRTKGAEDEYYHQNNIALLTANQMLFLPAEIRTLRGVTEAIYRNLTPFVCTAFSSDLIININTLTEDKAPLLAALFLNDISTSDAKALIKKRPQEGWKTVDAFIYQAQQDYSAAKERVDSLKKYLTITSHYFVTTTTVREGELTSGMRTFFYYDDKKKTIGIYLRQLTDGEHEE